MGTLKYTNMRYVIIDTLVFLEHKTDICLKHIPTLFSFTQVVANADQVGRMTDASKYTGAHKERFDADGKGKGAEGRTDKADNSGYVGNYKGEGSYKK